MAKVDREKKVIYGYSVMSIGEAKGHNFAVDSTTLSQLVEIGNAAPGGMKTKVQHPNQSSDGFGKLLGVSKNFRQEGNRVLADLHISPIAFSATAGGIGDYVMDLAEMHPDAFGASPEINYGLEPPKRGAVLPSVRLKKVKAIAFVDDPATNEGFFSALSVKENDMADTAELESKLADYAAKIEAASAKIQEVTASHAELSAKLESESKKRDEAAKADRERASDIVALCSKAGKADLAVKFIADGAPIADVQRHLLDVLLSANKPIGEGSAADLSAKDDPDAKYKAEFATMKTAYLAAGMTEEDFIKQRKIDDGAILLTTKAAS